MNSDFYSFLNQLISTPSVSSANPRLDTSNLPVIELLAERFTALGFTSEIIPLPGDNRKANLVATLGTGPGGLVLSGHTDTVPYDEGLWQVNPLQLTERDNRLYGLGSTDMKGFFAVIDEALRQQPLQTTELQQPLIILATADEESSMAGARQLAQQGYPQARAAVIGEPTSLVPIHMHKGIMMETIRVQGQSGHSSNAALGRNALDAMYDIITELIRFRTWLAAEYRNPHFDIDTATLNLGVIHGGDSPNRICGHCRLEFDIRLLPGMASDSLREKIDALIQPVAQRHDLSVTLTPLFPSVEPFSNLDSELATAAARLSGYQPESVAFTTEAPFLQSMGMDTIVMGPGSIDQAHQPDEFMALDQVQPCVNILNQLIRQYCQ